MATIQSFIKNTLAFAFALLLTNQILAGNEPMYNKWTSGSLTTGQVLNFADNKWPNLFPPASVGFTNVKAESHLILGFDVNHPVFQASAYTVELDLDVIYEDEQGGSTSVSRTLAIEYDPDGGKVIKAKSSVSFFPAHRMAITINTIRVNGTVATSVPAPVFLEAKINVERYYDFDCTAQSNVFTQGFNTPPGLDPGSGSIFIRWQEIPGAEEYDLEWLFVNDYDGVGGTLSANQLNYDFRHNGTRVSISGDNRYDFNLRYPQGYLVFRVRAVGRDASDPSQRQLGAWSIPESGLVSSVVGLNRYKISTGHEESLNWQSNTLYSADGKVRERLDYFDGTDRIRQTVMRNETDDQAIVAEVIYDNYGRPGVQILPAPTKEQFLRYYESFNQNVNGDAYSWKDFAIDQGSCAASADPLSTNSGAGKYFSPNNSDQSGAEAFVPNANQFPFSHTEYEPDNTGRVRRQGGNGDTHQLGSGHETRYFYGAPFQSELDRLFGTDAGIAERYKKSMRVDANSQVSLRYHDGHGRIVATALAGDTPSNLEAIGSNVGPTNFTIDLTEKNEFVPAEGALVASHELLVSSVGNYSFSYYLEPESFT
ncbi:MAG: DUF6443 domain-containing protein, partial [Bacteroidota bacterium]